MGRNNVLAAREKADHAKQVRATIGRLLPNADTTEQTLPDRLAADLLRTIEQSDGEAL